MPCDGVYAVEVTLENGTFFGMLNIGNRPTIGDSKKQIEVNIFDFDKDIYGQDIQIKFLKYLRPETKFEGVDELKKQLIRDREEAKALINKK